MTTSLPDPPTTAPAAVLFDMDGLLVDTEPLWTQAELELAERLGGLWDDEIKAQVVGTRLDVAVPAVLSYFGHEPSDELCEQTAKELLERVVELFAAPLTLLPGVDELLAALREAGIPVALVSSSYRVLVDAVLAHGTGPFAVTMAGDEVRSGKPSPEPYLTACRELRVAPEQCVVLEDSPAGVQSGEAAGCAVVAVPSLPSVEFDDRPRRAVVSSLREVDLRMLAALVAQPRTGRSHQDG